MKKILMKQIIGVLLCSAFVVSTGKAFSLFGTKESNPFAQCEELFKRSQYFEAISCYERMFPAVTTCSENMLIRARLNYAESLLGVGDYVNGFRELDWRLTKRDPLQSPWNGSDPAGKTMLVIAEQGLGDTFFFLRYAQELKRLGAKVILLAQRPLKKLLTHCSYLDLVVVRGDALPSFDYDVYLMSLPRYISQKGLVPTTLETIPTPGIPYIAPGPSLAASWRQKLSSDKNFKVGICWRASKLPAGQVRYLERDIPLSLLLKTIPSKGISIYSFQGPGHRPVRETEFKKLQAAGQLGELDVFDVIPDNAPVIHGIQGDGWPFEDDAAAMKCMDLMICVDTSVPHLAAAMYCPVWIVLPFEADWRWMTMINVSPWHPTALLFRQEKQGNWAPVMNVIRQELHTKMASKKPKKSCFDRFCRR